jgi:CubicO group peptidase (beta-lactamase class C family)
VRSTDLTRRAALTLALGAGVAARAAPAPSPAASPWMAVDAVAAALIADKASPGVSVSVMKAGRLVYSKGFGFANLETRTPATATSIYKIGSITKQFTAAALMTLQEAGKLSVDDRLSKFFPDFPRGGEITLRQMLTHTSGLGNYTDTDTRETFIQEARLDYDAAALYKLMLQTKPLFAHEPGTVWDYSNTAYVLLGLIAEKVAGEAYGAFYKRRLFDRAGLVDTAVDDAAEVVVRRASGYTPHAGGGAGEADRTAFDNASFISMTIPGGAGSMRSTTEDLCRWHAALFGGRIVSAESLKAMTTPHRLKDGALPNEAPEPGAPGEAKPVEYGFGLGTSTIEGRRAIGHAGGINGFSSTLQTFPAESISFAMLINCDGGARLGPDAKTLRAAVAKAALA